MDYEDDAGGMMKVFIVVILAVVVLGAVAVGFVFMKESKTETCAEAGGTCRAQVPGCSAGESSQPFSCINHFELCCK